MQGFVKTSNHCPATVTADNFETPAKCTER